MTSPFFRELVMVQINAAFVGTPGDDDLVGTSSADTFDISAGGVDSVLGKGGSDTIFAGGTLSTGDMLNGGSGFDTLTLEGEYSLVLSGSTLTSIEGVHLNAGGNYSLAFDDTVVAAGAQLIVNGNAVDSIHTVFLDGSVETDGQLIFSGGAGDDHLIGGAQFDTLSGNSGDDIINGGRLSDTIKGGRGADDLRGGKGADTFVYSSAKDSTGLGFDRISDLHTNSDRIDLPTTVVGIDSDSTGGTLSVATFDDDLRELLEPGDGFHPSHAKLVHPTAGDFAGDYFLVVDMDGDGEYQAGKDLVINLGPVPGTSNLDTDVFI